MEGNTKMEYRLAATPRSRLNHVTNKQRVSLRKAHHYEGDFIKSEKELLTEDWQKKSCHLGIFHPIAFLFAGAQIW